MKVKTDYTGCEYITAGKEYEVFDVSPEKDYGSIICDEGIEIDICFYFSKHIGWTSWQIIEGEEA